MLAKVCELIYNAWRGVDKDGKAVDPAKLTDFLPRFGTAWDQPDWDASRMKAEPASSRPSGFGMSDEDALSLVAQLQAAGAKVRE